MSCSEVSGLEMEYDIIEYRAGDSPVFTKQKMPGLRKAGEVTLKKGIFKDDKAMWDWINKVKLNTIQRERMAQENHGGRIQGRRQHRCHRDFGTGARRCEYSEEVIWLILLHHNLPLNGFRPSHFTFR